MFLVYKCQKCGETVSTLISNATDSSARYYCPKCNTSGIFYADNTSTTLTEFTSKTYVSAEQQALNELKEFCVKV